MSVPNFAYLSLLFSELAYLFTEEMHRLSSVVSSLTWFGEDQLQLPQSQTLPDFWGGNLTGLTTK